MPRKGPAGKRPVVVDPVYESPLVTQLVNKVLLDGKKSTAESIVYGALEGCREIAVTNNQILDPLHRGIWLESSSGCRIGDNTILDRRPRSKMVEKIGGDGKGENRIEEG